MTQQRLTKELVTSSVASYLDEMKHAAKAYQRGILTEDYGYRIVEDAFYDSFWSVLKKNHLELKLDDTNYEQFKKEHQIYLLKEAMTNPNHVPWLYDVETAPVEASENDQKLFFALMDYFALSASFFEPYPDETLKPNKTYVHTYNSASVIWIPFNCIQDSGLLNDDNPAGKAYILVNDYGLKAEVTIQEDRRTENRLGMDFDEIVLHRDGEIAVLKAEFLATGNIEGYTAKERSGNAEILIRLISPDRIGWLSFWENADDLRAHYDHPIWKEFYIINHKHLMARLNYYGSQYETLIKSL